MIDTDRERITKKMLAHVNRHMQIQKRRNWFEKIIYNPLKFTGGTWLLLIFGIIGTIVFVESAEAVDEFFNARTQRFLLVWCLPVGCGLGFLGWVWYRIRR